MSGLYTHAAGGLSGPSMMENNYPVFDGNFNASYARLSGPSTHFDGVAFWYNPTTTEPLYERADPSLFNPHGIALQPGSMEAANIKHRRTRSGCFTCRSRRVKCDEKRPICDRCKKGNRECEFPQTNSSSKRSKHSESRSPKDRVAKTEHKDETMSSLETIKDESEEEDDDDKAFGTTSRPFSPARTESTQSISKVTKPQYSFDRSHTSKDQTSPSSTDASSSHSRADTPASSLRTVTHSVEMQARQAKIRLLKPDLQKYLQFQQEHMTHYHYFYKLDPTDFVHCEFIDLALSFEPLLYAVIGFAAYHYELRQPDGRLSNFLGYHSRSLSMLRKSLEKNAKVTPATLLTVLQLATFEEYIGDWVNLVGHHRASFSMLRELYTADNFVITDLGRRIFSWFGRLDVMVGLIAGNETRIERQWFEANAIWYHSQINVDPEGDVDVENTLAYFVAMNRLLGMDQAGLFAKLPKGEISMEEFHIENAQIVERRDTMKRQLESFNDEYYRIQEFAVEKTQPLGPDDIVNPYIPGGLFKDALWPVNFLWLDWYGIEQMQKYQTALVLQQPIAAELEQLSLEQCRIYEAIDRWPDAPEGAILGAHASLGLATVFLKKDARHVMWARKKLAAVERLGYIFPPTFRRKMAEIWGLTNSLVGEDETVEDWWLPHNEGNLPLLQEIRNVVAERHQNDTGTGADALADVRDMKALFAKLDIRTQMFGPTGENLSPLSESSGTNSDPMSNTSFSPTTGLGDPFVRSASTGAGARNKSQPIRANSKS